MKKICIVGTHGCGKTTLSYALGAYYKRLGANAHVISEMARRCPFALNDSFNIYGAQWIVHALIAEELLCKSQRYEVLISDRSPMDTIMYGKSREVDHCDGFHTLTTTAFDWMRTYDQVIWVAKPSDNIISDGIRCSDPEWRNKVHEYFSSYFSNHTSLGTKLYLVSQENIFNDPNICMDINSHGLNWSLPKHLGNVGGVSCMGHHGFPVGGL